MRTQHTPDISSIELEGRRYDVTNTATGLRRVMSRHELADYIRAHARSPEHVPLGDYLHSGLQKVGFTGCLPCAERQAALNRLVRRR